MNASSLMNLGKPNAEQLRVAMPQNLVFGEGDAAIDVPSYFGEMGGQIFIRRHPDGEHLFAMIAIGCAKPGCSPMALFSPVWADELERFSEEAFRAAQRLRQHNKAAVPSDAPMNTERGA